MGSGGGDSVDRKAEGSTLNSALLFLFLFFEPFCLLLVLTRGSGVEGMQHHFEPGPETRAFT